MGIKENAKNADTWIRGLYIVVFGIIFYFLVGLIWLLVVFQFVMKVLTGELNQRLLDLGEAIARFVYQILQYITFKSEHRPYPFNPWPDSTDAVPAVKTTTNDRTGKKTQTRKSASKK